MNVHNMIDLLLTINVHTIIEGCDDGDPTCLDCIGEVLRDIEARFPVGQC